MLKQEDDDDDQADFHKDYFLRLRFRSVEDIHKFVMLHLPICVDLNEEMLLLLLIRFLKTDSGWDSVNLRVWSADLRQTKENNKVKYSISLFINCVIFDYK